MGMERQRAEEGNASSIPCSWSSILTEIPGLPQGFCAVSCASASAPSLACAGCSPATAVTLSPGCRQCAAVTTHFSLMMDPPQKPTPLLSTRWTCGSRGKSHLRVCASQWGRRVGSRDFVWLQDRLWLGCTDIALTEMLLVGVSLHLHALCCHRGWPVLWERSKLGAHFPFDSN